MNDDRIVMRKLIRKDKINIIEASNALAIVEPKNCLFLTILFHLCIQLFSIERVELWIKLRYISYA